jgi:dTDP-4-amino-4,6-dideoxygalactose transaminase
VVLTDERSGLPLAGAVPCPPRENPCGAGQQAALVPGDEETAFEKQLTVSCEVNHCAALNSGTRVLHLALLAAGPHAGNEVIPASNTLVATAEAISCTGATPVFMDIDPCTA